jgi:TrmH family RNA methyltransferase
VEGVEKPGNLGALLRTASALGVDAVWACDCPVDLYHPNALRNSLGGLFDLTLVQCESREALSWLKAREVQVVTTYLEGASALHTLTLTTASALVVGAEDKGVSPVWVEGSDALALIPMSGVVDSLNVSVAAGMALYEATRQRAQA